MFLMIRNKGVADHRGLTILGASSSRYSKNSGTLGMFGSGCKSSILLCLRKGIRPQIYCGTLKMEFYTEPTKIGDNQFNQLCVKYSGKDDNGNTKNSTEKLSMSTEWGVFDWKDISMAFREFVSNAIDGAIQSGGSYNDVEFEIVKTPRAKAGYTSVYLPYESVIEKCYLNIGERFLHFSKPKYLKEIFIPKDEIGEDTKIYKNGVLVCKIHKPSIFDYNLKDLELDESRNADRWSAIYQATNAIKHASHEIISRVLRSITKYQNILEGELDSSYLRYSQYDTPEIKTKFQTAFKTVFTDKGVINTIPQFADFIKNKGYIPVQLGNPKWEEVLSSYGCPSETSILDTNELANRVELPISEDQKKAMNWAWNLVKSFNMHNNKEYPKLVSFRYLENGNSQVKGYCDMDKGIIGLHADIGGTELRLTCLHELSHHITKSGDATRDLEDYLLRLVTLIAS